MFSGCCGTWLETTLWHARLRAYQPGSDTAGTGFEQVLAQASGKDLKWFFDDWVYHDRGLPDLSIAGVFPNKASVPGLLYCPPWM